MRPSGEILRVTTADVILVILGPRIAPIGTRPVEPPSFMPASAHPIGEDTAIEPESGEPLFDDVRYTIQVSAVAPREVSIAHRRLNVQWTSHRGSWFGTTTLQLSQVGWAEIRIGDDCGVRIRVVPRKLDYETDYRAMVQDLENQVRGLSAKLLSIVREPMDASPQPFDLWSHWLAVLETIWADLERDLLAAWNAIAPALRRQESSVYIDRLAHPQIRDLRALSQSAPRRVSAEVRRWELLTDERRYLLQLLTDVGRRLERILATVPELGGNRQLVAIQRRVGKVLTRLLAEVRVDRVIGPPRIPSSPLARVHPALKRVIQGHRMLEMGLFPSGDRYLVGPKDVSLLYEYWCYLTIVRMMVAESGGILGISPTSARDPIDIVLPSGVGGAVRIALPDGESIEILYQRRFQGLPTVAQQPDHVVQIRGAKGVLVFDAKYRFELDDRVCETYSAGSPIPPVATINAMHQYHDAIVAQADPYLRLVDRAVVLFPLPKEYVDDWIRHRFYRSIAAVGVGAIPLLPGAGESYLRDELQRYLVATARASQAATERPPSV